MSRHDMSCHDVLSRHVRRAFLQGRLKLMTGVMAWLRRTRPKRRGETRPTYVRACPRHARNGRQAGCPHCGQHIEFPAHGVGATIECPSCSNPFTLAAPVPPVLPQQPAKPNAQKVPRTLSTDPASEKQIAYLRHLGYEPRGPLTKGEASSLIDERWQEESAKASERAWTQMAEEKDANTAWVLHENLIDAKRQLANAEKGDIADA